MKRYKISHTSHYAYDQNIFFEPQTLRFKPINTQHAALKKFSLDITPTPDGTAEIIDPENNLIHNAWFSETHTDLTITAKSVVEVIDYNPLNFIIHPDNFNKIPFAYGDAYETNVCKFLQNYLTKEKISPELENYAEQILQQINHATINFLIELTRKIHQDFTLINREKGKPFHANKTFNKKSASCRDVSWLQIQILRNLGIASRFVSGYFFVPADENKADEENHYELHAWLEVYLPGAGWLGFDPSHGLICTSNHITIARSATPENTMPITGNTRGNANAKLTTKLKIELSEK